MQNRLNPSVSLSTDEISIILEYFPQGICALDLEMTGLSPIFDKIIEIAACKINPDGNVDIFHSLVNPLISIPEHTIKYHGLKNSDLKDAPTLKKPLRDLIEFYGQLPLVAHSAQFDIGFIIRGIHDFNLDISLSDIYDSCRTARTLYKKNPISPKSFKLEDLANFYQIEFTHHKALDDSIVCLKVFAACLRFLKQKRPSENIKNVGFLFKLNSFKQSGDYILPNKLTQLKEVTARQTPIYIKYKGGRLKGKFRPIKPISLMPLPQGLILYGECLLTQINKYFQVKKIQSLCLKDTN